jgi:hypothetical protein
MQIIKAAKDSFKAVKEHKLLFFILFLLQSAFIIVSSSVFISSFTAMGSNLKAFLEPIEGIAEISEEELMTADALQPIVEKYAYYRAFFQNLITFIVLMYLVYILVNGLIWYISDHIVNKKFSFLRYIACFSSLVIVFTLPFFALINISINYIFNINQIKLAVIIHSIVALLLLYFMYVSFAGINKIKKFRDVLKIIKKAQITAGEKIYIIIPALILTTGLPVLLIFIISKLLESNFYLLLFVIALLVIAINLGRIIFLALIKNLK